MIYKIELSLCTFDISGENIFFDPASIEDYAWFTISIFIPGAFNRISDWNSDLYLTSDTRRSSVSGTAGQQKVFFDQFSIIGFPSVASYTFHMKPRN